MSRSPIVRWILQGFVAFALLAFSVVLTVFIVNVTYRYRAESLLSDLQTLRVGKSTTADVQRIMNRHGGSTSPSYPSFCTPIDGAYDVWIGSQPIARLAQSIPFLRRFGLRPWGTAATVVLREGRVCFLSYSLAMEDPKGNWEWQIESTLLPEQMNEVLGTEHHGYRTGTQDIRNFRILRSEVTPQATEEQRREAFTYDLSCVTSFRGCRGRCQIAPLVWEKVYRESINEGGKMPLEETSDPHCKFAESTN